MNSQLTVSKGQNGAAASLISVLYVSKPLVAKAFLKL